MIPNKQFIGTTKRCAKAYPDCGFRPVSFAVRRIYINNIEARKVIINGNATAPFFVNNGAPFPKYYAKDVEIGISVMQKQKQ